MQAQTQVLYKWMRGVYVGSKCSVVPDLQGAKFSRNNTSIDMEASLFPSHQPSRFPSSFFAALDQQFLEKKCCAPWLTICVYTCMSQSKNMPFYMEWGVEWYRESPLWQTYRYTKNTPNTLSFSNCQMTLQVIRCW